MSSRVALIVDDEEGILEVIQDYIEMSGLGLKIFTAKSVDVALPIVEKEDPDVIITDISMPGKSGLDFLKILQTRPKKVPVIVVSGYGDKDMISKAWKHGAFDFLDKPINSKRLIEIIKIAIDHKQVAVSANALTTVEPPNLLIILSDAQYIHAAKKAQAANANINDWAREVILNSK